MKKRKMLRDTTLLISAFVIVTLLIGTYFLIYRHLSTYESRLEIVQKDLLINFQTEVDDILDSCSRFIASSVLEEHVIQFATEQELDNYNVYLTEKFFKRDFLSQDTDCIFGIFRPERDIFITNAGVLYSWDLTKKYDFTPEFLEAIRQLPEQEFVNNYYLTETLSVNGERLNVFLKRSLPNNSSTDVYGFISINLKAIAKQLSQLEDNVFFAFKEGELFFSSQPGTEPARMQLLHEPSETLFDLGYATGAVKPKKALLLLMYILLFMLLAAAGLYGSFFLAKQLNRPIENILRQLSYNEEDVYDEEAYIRNRFVEIKAVNQQLEKEISSQGQYVRQGFIRDLLYGMVHEDTLSEVAERYGLLTLCGDVALAVLEEKHSEAQGAMVFHQITALLETKIEGSVVIFLSSEQVVVIARQIALDVLKKEIAQAILQISEWYNVSYTGAICEGNIESPKELSALFNEAMRYLQNGDFSYDKLVITADELREREEYGYYYPLEFERNIINSIARNDFDRAMQIVQIILNKNLVEMKLGKTALTELKFAFVATIKRILQVLKKPESELFGEGSILYLELSACKTAEEVSAKIYEMFSAVRDYMGTAYDTANHVLISRVEQYIQENYAREDMSLLLLAEHFNLTAGYISKIFKRCRQVNFKEYLSAYRIQKATEILEETPYIRIMDLARQVGYDNVNSFIRNFKKLKNISPSEYKKQQ